jgi:cytosine/adenosine deaminase-related metal-dependent hydrolase
VVDLSRRLDRPVHTHLLETAAEEAAVRGETGMGQMEFLDRAGVLDRPLSVAHGVRFGAEHLGTLSGRPLGIVHCPSSNAKLGSGIADLVFQGEAIGISRGIGTDGAACNNTLNILEEMRLAARLQALHQGPGRVRAEEVLGMATLEGARAIGMEAELGSLEPGKRGDLAILDLAGPGTAAVAEVSPAVRLVHGAGRDAVRWVVVDGEILVDRGTLPHLDVEGITRRALEEAEALRTRAALS